MLIWRSSTARGWRNWCDRLASDVSLRPSRPSASARAFEASGDGSPCGRRCRVDLVSAFSLRRRVKYRLQTQWAEYDALLFFSCAFDEHECMRALWMRNRCACTIGRARDERHNSRRFAAELCALSIPSNIFCSPHSIHTRLRAVALLQSSTTKGSDRIVGLATRSTLPNCAPRHRCSCSTTRC